MAFAIAEAIVVARDPGCNGTQALGRGGAGEELRRLLLAAHHTEGGGARAVVVRPPHTARGRLRMALVAVSCGRRSTGCTRTVTAPVGAYCAYLHVYRAVFMHVVLQHAPYIGQVNS